MEEKPGRKRRRGASNPPASETLDSLYQLLSNHPCTADGCRKAFQTQADLDRHVWHHGGTYVCDQEGCGENFAKLGPFQSHRLTHLGPTPFACTEDGCAKSFSKKGALKGHMVSDRGWSAAPSGTSFYGPFPDHALPRAGIRLPGTRLPEILHPTAPPRCAHHICEWPIASSVRSRVLTRCPSAAHGRAGVRVSNGGL